MTVYRARILSGGRVTLPVAMRRELDLRPGDEIAFDQKRRRFSVIRHHTRVTRPRQS